MESDSLLHFANFSTLVMCMVLKFPQIFLLMRAKTSTGVSFNSLLLELLGYVIDYYYYYIKCISILYPFSRACCNQFTNISAVSRSATHRSEACDPNSAKKRNSFLCACFVFPALLSDVLAPREIPPLVSMAREIFRQRSQASPSLPRRVVACAPHSSRDIAGCAWRQEMKETPRQI